MLAHDLRSGQVHFLPRVQRALGRWLREKLVDTVSAMWRLTSLPFPAMPAPGVIRRCERTRKYRH